MNEGSDSDDKEINSDQNSSHTANEVHSYFMDRAISDSDDDNTSFKSCSNGDSEHKDDDNEGNVNDEENRNTSENYPPEPSQDSDDVSLSSDSSDNSQGTNYLYYSENESLISDPARMDDGDDDDDNPHQTSFQRDLLDYLGSLFSVSSRLHSRINQPNLEIGDDELEEYMKLRQKVDNELKVLGIGKCVEMMSNVNNIARNLGMLMMARERGDWGSCRAGHPILWSYEKTISSKISNKNDTEMIDLSKSDPEVAKGATDSGEPQEKSMRMMNDCNNQMTVEEEGWQDSGKWGEEDRCAVKEDDNDDEEHKESSKMLNNLVGRDDSQNGVLQFRLSPDGVSAKKDAIIWNSTNDNKNMEHIVIGGFRRNNFWSDIYGSRWALQRLGLEARLRVHTGCVNALHFSSSGSWLASGSDDRRVVISDWATQRVLMSASTDHISNIFQVRFLPACNDMEIITCSRDMTVRHMVLHPAGNGGGRRYCHSQYQQLETQSSRLLTQHRDCCHKTDVPLDSPRLVLSAGEDTRVMASDIRCETSSRLTTVEKVPLYTIACSPVRSQEFAVAGKDCRVFIYDRRHATRPLHVVNPPHLTSGGARSGSSRTTGARHSTVSSTGGFHVTAVTYSRDGNSVLASYNDEDIYLLSTRPTSLSTSAATCSLPESSPVIHTYKGHRNVQTVTGVAFYGPEQEFVVSGSNDGHVILWEKDTEAVVHWVRADEAGVVNVLESHPRLPLLATAGLDSDVKLWSMLQKPMFDSNSSFCSSNGNRKESDISGVKDLTRQRGLPLDSGVSLADTDPETARIDAAWTRAYERANIHESNDEVPLPFELRDLKLITALNWKMRDESYPYSFDNTLDNFILMSRRRNRGEFSNFYFDADAMESDSGESMVSITDTTLVHRSTSNTGNDENSAGGDDNASQSEDGTTSQRRNDDSSRRRRGGRTGGNRGSGGGSGGQSETCRAS